MRRQPKKIKWNFTGKEGEAKSWKGDVHTLFDLWEWEVIEDLKGRFYARTGLTTLDASFSTAGEAQQACQKLFDKHWLSMSKDIPFWRPIKSCPKDPLVTYFLYNEYTKSVMAGTWNDTWSGVTVIKLNTEKNALKNITTPTHFAEIPDY